MKKFLSLASVFALLLVANVVQAASVEKTDGFVCPVFHSSSVGENNPNAVPIAGGDYTILGPDVSVPIQATNGDGAGSPGGSHSAPGDTDYTPIWNLGG